MDGETAFFLEASREIFTVITEHFSYIGNFYVSHEICIDKVGYLLCFIAVRSFSGELAEKLEENPDQIFLCADFHIKATEKVIGDIIVCLKDVFDVVKILRELSFKAYPGV